MAHNVIIGSAIRTVSCMLLIVLVWFTGVFIFARHIDDYALADGMTADGIIVLTGGGGRVEYGLTLLGTGRGQALFISGVDPSVPMADVISKAPAAVRSVLAILSRGKITLGREAVNTIGNAQESTDWIIKHHFSTILLVTADYHMLRALAEFEAYLPQGVLLIPAAVKTGNYNSTAWFADAPTRNLIFGEFNKFLAAKLRHYLILVSQKK